MLYKVLGESPWIIFAWVLSTGQLYDVGVRLFSCMMNFGSGHGFGCDDSTNPGVGGDTRTGWIVVDATIFWGSLACVSPSNITGKFGISCV